MQRQIIATTIIVSAISITLGLRSNPHLGLPRALILKKPNPAMQNFGRNCLPDVPLSQPALEAEGGSGIECRSKTWRHTFATRFAFAGGSLSVLSKILRHADLSLQMRYVHPAQAEMDRAMEWYSKVHTPGPELEKFSTASWIQ